MLHAITYSLIRHLREQVPALTEVVWFYDGISLTGKVKPFVVVEHLAEQNEVLAAGRNDYEEIYRLQIALRANSESELSKTSETVKSALRNQITFYNTDSPTPISEGYFYADLDAYTRIKDADSTNETDRHRGYFDVSIELYRENGASNFTQ